jgi:hypothetical protein
LLEGRAFIGIMFCGVSVAGIGSVRGRESRSGSRVGSAGFSTAFSGAGIGSVRHSVQLGIQTCLRAGLLLVFGFAVSVGQASVQ